MQRRKVRGNVNALFPAITFKNTKKMITNFENITHELTDDELAIVPLVISGFKRYTKDFTIKAPDVVSRFNASGKSHVQLTEPRLRKIVNYIRSNGLIALVATSQGYYVSSDKDEIMKQVESLRQRANSIHRCADGLQLLLNKLG